MSFLADAPLAMKLCQISQDLYVFYKTPVIKFLKGTHTW